MRPILATTTFLVAFLILAPKPTIQLSAEEVNERTLAGFVTEAPEIEAMKNYNFSYLGVDSTFDELASQWAFCPQGVTYHFNVEHQQGKILCDILNRQPNIDADFLRKAATYPERKYVDLHSANYVFIFKSSPQNTPSFLGHTLELTWTDGTHRTISKIDDNYDSYLLRNLTAINFDTDFDIGSMSPEFYYGYMKQLYLGHP